MGVVVVDLGAVAGALALLAAEHPREASRAPPRRPRCRSRRARAAASAARALRRLWRPGHRELERGGPGLRSSKRTAAGCGALAATRSSASSPPSTTPAAGRREAREAASSSAREPQRAWWSSSTLVITAISGCSSRKLASDSSASATTHSPVPQPAFAAPPPGPAPGQLAADEERGVGADGRERVDDHPGCRRLAVRAGDRDQPPQRAELGEQLAAVHHPLAALAGDAPARGCPRRSRSRRRPPRPAGTLAASWPIRGVETRAHAGRAR